jgi:small subunit ribosomal protein S11
MADDKKSTNSSRRAGKRARMAIPSAQVYVKAGYNNTILTLTDPNGSVLARASAGASGFKGTKKSTPYAAQVAAENLAALVEPFGVENLQVFVKGAGPGREQSIRGLAKSFSIDLIVDHTSLPHNGCRKKKRRRV